MIRIVIWIVSAAFATLAAQMRRLAIMPYVKQHMV